MISNTENQSLNREKNDYTFIYLQNYDKQQHFSDIPRFLSEESPHNKERFEIYKLKTK